MHFLPWAWRTIGTLLAHRTQEAREGRARQLDYEVVRVTGWIERMRGQHQLVIEPRLQIGCADSCVHSKELLAVMEMGKHCVTLQIISIFIALGPFSVR